MFDQCWTNVVDGGPTLVKHWLDVSCLLGYSSFFTLGARSLIFRDNRHTGGFELFNMFKNCSRAISLHFSRNVLVQLFGADRGSLGKNVALPCSAPTSAMCESPLY